MTLIRVILALTGVILAGYGVVLLSDNPPAVIARILIWAVVGVAIHDLVFAPLCVAAGWVGRRVIADLRRDLFDQFLNLPCTYYDHASSGQLLAKLLYNTEQVANSLTKGVVAVFKDGLTIVGLTLLMVYENVLLSLVFMVVGPVLGVSIRVVSKRFRKISMRIQESMGNVGHVAQEHQSAGVVAGRTQRDRAQDHGGQGVADLGVPGHPGAQDRTEGLLVRS